MSDKVVDDVWQIDSDWINLSTSTAANTNSSKQGGSASNISKMKEPNQPINFHFIPAPAKAGQAADRYLVIDRQTLRLGETRSTGHTFWVCSIPCCTARCVLDPTQSRIVYACREHNHETDVSRQEYKNFIHALKMAVRDRPQEKPKMLYDAEVEKAKVRFFETRREGDSMEPSLPSYDAVRAAMCNSRNAMLSLVSLRPAAEEDDMPEDVQVTPDITPPAGRGGRSTRSRMGSSSSRKKSANKSLMAKDDPDGEWPDTPHKTANLSDLEDWLEDDVNANFSAQVAAVRASRGKSGAVRQLHGLSESPRRKAKGKASPRAVSDDEDSQQDEQSLSGNNVNGGSDQGGVWDGLNSLEAIPKRKYRKRPASSSVFTCPHCPYKSNRHFNVQRHERLAHSSKKPEFSCKECGTSYSLEYRLKLHIKAVHQGEGHHCTICQRTFETMTGLKSHMVTKHKNEDPNITPRKPPPELTCNLCGRVFSTKSHLQKHTSSHVMVQPFRCCVCNAAFMDESAWLSHQATCQDAFTIQCCLCSAFLPSAYKLMVHMDEVHGRAEYDCRCGKSFPWKKSLLTHQQKCSLFLSEKMVA